MPRLRPPGPVAVGERQALGRERVRACTHKGNETLRAYVSLAN
jgi:hypothetical protein